MGGNKGLKDKAGVMRLKLWKREYTFKVVSVKIVEGLEGTKGLKLCNRQVSDGISEISQ